MLQTDLIVAYTASFLSIGLAHVDIYEGGKVLGIEKPFTKPRAPTIRHELRTASVSSAGSSIRASTSLAFFYLAYKDYKRATAMVWRPTLMSVLCCGDGRHGRYAGQLD